MNNLSEFRLNTPLNGMRTHPLSTFALDALVRIARGAVPRQEFNPGVCNRLERENLVERQAITSPYKSGKGKIDHLVITEAGRDALRAAGR